MEQITFRELTDKMFLLYTERKYAEALQLVEQQADHFPEEAARTTFWKMCLLSLLGRSTDVLSVFQQGLDSGLWWAESQFIDSDLDAVRDLPEFKRLMGVSQEKYQEARKGVKPDKTVLLPDTPASGKYPLLIALHGRNGSKNANLEHWEAARHRGWLVLSTQSTQPLFSGSYCWDDPTQGLADLSLYYEQVSQEYPIDPQHVVLAGFSQGSGMAIQAALGGKFGARGFIGVGTFIAEPDSLIPLAKQGRSVRGYFVIGKKDHTLDKVRAIQTILKGNNIPFAEEVYPDLGHEFPADFGSSFDKAIKFILE